MKAKTCSPCQMYPMKPFPHVWLDFAAGGQYAGRVEVELYADVPKTSENFRCLVTGEKGMGKKGKALHYKDSFQGGKFGTNDILPSS